MKHMTEKRYKHSGSVFSNEQTLLKTIIALHIPEKRIQLDPMYYKGNFYKEVEKPEYYFDISPAVDCCAKADARHLPFKDNTVSSMILDPPFMFNWHGKTGKHQKSYYSSKTHGIYKNFTALRQTYQALLDEAQRILKKKGVLIFKCQDYTDSKTTLTHAYVWKWALDRGFYAKDLAILHLPRNKVTNTKLKQRHLRKKHSYFYVFINGDV
jgi:hypothetical protein